MKAFSIHSMAISADRARFTQKTLAEPPAPNLAMPNPAILPGYDQLLANMAEKDVLLIQDRLPLSPIRRLVVLVPRGEIDEPALARRVWEIATGFCAAVLYLALSPNELQSAHQRRRLADLAAGTSGQNVRASSNVSAAQDWHQALERVLKPGDLVVCLANHKISRYFAWRKPLGERLVEWVGMPVFMLSGFKIDRSWQEHQTLKAALSWVGFGVLLAAFFGMQAGISRATSRPLSSILLCLSVMVEVYLLWKINDWIG